MAVFDGRRWFQGKPQLSVYENQILARIAEGKPLVALCERGGKAYYVGKIKVRAETAQRLIYRQYLQPRDRGLLPEAELAQSFEVAPHCEVAEGARSGD